VSPFSPPGSGHLVAQWGMNVACYTLRMATALPPSNSPSAHRPGLEMVVLMGYNGRHLSSAAGADNSRAFRTA
jgi:hypothetical protein